MKVLIICIGILGIFASTIAIGLAILSDPVWAGIGNAMVILYCLFIFRGILLFWKNEIGCWD